MKTARRPRAYLALTLNLVALTFAVSAVTTSYWCEGTRKVVKPFCTGPVSPKQTYCIRFNSSNLNDSRLVQYIWETGEDKFIMRKFHTGIWVSCEQSINMIGFTCRNFLEIAPAHERGVLWLCIVAECFYIGLLFMGGLLMSLEMCCCCNLMNGLKMNAFAAVLTALSGLLGMVAHMMFTTAFQLSVSLGPEDWRPKTWDYSWSYLLAWCSFAACMASAVATLNRYTKTIIEFRHKRRVLEKHLRLEQKLMELDSPLWDLYVSSVPSTTEELLELSSKPSDSSVFLEPNGMADLPNPPGQPEDYC
ncbi:germ cell-specific gene 1-like protein [Megalops cyprinoides]|uniref:germ cell-specific gene 1-like protein n=1 Tax=Megalops cyprinoides TaxID=118141 RepID=UPI001864EC32|nr:germ cell-specific gene 1-like protein [Megalops cyprinoides]